MSKRTSFKKITTKGGKNSGYFFLLNFHPSKTSIYRTWKPKH
jgi:hypothetical protein